MKTPAAYILMQNKEKKRKVELDKLMVLYTIAIGLKTKNNSNKVYGKFYP